MNLEKGTKLIGTSYLAQIKYEGLYSIHGFRLNEKVIKGFKFNSVTKAV